MRVGQEIYESEGYWRDGGPSGHGEWEPYEQIFEYLCCGFKVNRLLDVGCGPGGFIRYGQPGHTFGLDFSKYAVRNPLPGAEGLIAFGDIYNIPFKDGFFDLVTAFNMLEHVQPDRADEALKEIFRVSKKWVVLMICVNTDYQPSLEYDYAGDDIERYSIRIQGEIKRGHWCVHSREWWLKKIESAGAIEAVPETQLLLNFTSSLIPETDKNWTKQSKGLFVFKKDSSRG